MYMFNGSPMLIRQDRVLPGNAKRDLSCRHVFTLLDLCARRPCAGAMLTFYVYFQV